jgi:hypothetical protein
MTSCVFCRTSDMPTCPTAEHVLLVKGDLLIGDRLEWLKPITVIKSVSVS